MHCEYNVITHFTFLRVLHCNLYNLVCLCMLLLKLRAVLDRLTLLSAYSLPANRSSTMAPWSPVVGELVCPMFPVSHKVWIVVAKDDTRCDIECARWGGKLGNVEVSKIYPTTLCVWIDPEDVTTPTTLAVPSPEIPLTQHLTGVQFQEWFKRTYAEPRMQSDASVFEWMNLPGMPGNKLRIQRNHRTGCDPITSAAVLSSKPFAGQPVLYPSLVSRGLTAEFWSQQFQELIIFEFADALAWCPQDHVWVICLACDKFHFPSCGDNCHRGSKRHLAKEEWALCYGLERTMCYYNDTSSTSRPRFM
jgi:hypothetical protein